MLKSENGYQIPEETVKLAKSAFPNGNIGLTLRDNLDPIIVDDNLKNRYPAPGQLAEAVCCRFNWEYILGLRLDNPGFIYSVLNEFRQHPLEGKKKQRTDSTHVIAVVRELSLLELSEETM